ncbi:MAG TPA: hypothetical protein VD968_13900, partial [Pyrinomonadaceae bacterium]|nr:hypothetical protein [Pyrinomonadaceae bacterium]
MHAHTRRRAAAACAVVVSLLLHTSPASARRQAPAKKFELTVDSIMRGPDLVGYEPTGVTWSQDSSRLFFRWKRAGEPRLKEFDTYVVNRDGTGLRKLSEEEARRTAPPSSGELSKDKTLTVFTDEGDLFLYDHAKGERRQVTRTVEAETNPHFTRDQKGIYFTRQNNLYVMSLDSGSLEQLTDIRAAAAGGDPQARAAGGGAAVTGGAGVQLSASVGPQRGASESQEVLRREERRLLEAVRERAENREEQERRRRERNKRRPFSLPAGQSVANLMLSPDGANVIAAVTESAQGSKSTIVPNYVTESAYTEDIPSRTKVGDTQGRSRLGLVSVETGEVKWVDHGQRVEVAPRVQSRTEQNATEQAARERGVEAEAQQQSQQQGQQATSPPPTQAQQQQGRQQTEAARADVRDRDVQLFQIQWSEDGTRAALLARAADNKDRWVLSLDPATGKTRALARVHDDAWVGGPGAFTLGWLADNR